MPKSLLFKDDKNLFPESIMKPLKLLAIHLLYLATACRTYEGTDFIKKCQILRCDPYSYGKVYS
jgi:hypothetical protein